MARKLLITRREFMGLSAAGSVAIASEPLFAQTPPPTPDPTTTPTPSPTPTPEPPAAPGFLTLAGDEDDLNVRGDTYLGLKWERVANADRYEVQLEWAQGAETVTSMTEETRVNALTPNRTYQIKVRAVNTDGASPWSKPLKSCTRPPQPDQPSQRYSSMVDVPKEFSLHWDLAGLVAQADEPASIRVELGRADDNQKIVPVQSNLKTVDEQIVANDKKLNPYHIRLVSPNPTVASGKNMSQWSLGIAPASLFFSELRFPTLQETQQLSVRIMRNYYG